MDQKLESKVQMNILPQVIDPCAAIANMYEK